MARIPGLKVVRSLVEGYGVIATRRFRKGSVITNVDGVLWRRGEQRDDRYSLILEEGVFFDMVDQTRWVNHSCEPNVVVEAGVTRNGNGWAQLQALREIEPGDELFYDYALPPELKERCHCGARTCRGWIVDPLTAGRTSSRPAASGTGTSAKAPRPSRPSSRR